MPPVQMHLHVTEEAAALLEKYCSNRGRGAFISQLVVAYDRDQNGGEIALELLRKQAIEAQRRATQAQNALKAAEELQQAGAPTNGTAARSTRSKKRR